MVDAAIVDGTAHLTSLFWGMLAEGTWRDARGRNLLDGGCPTTPSTRPPTAAGWPSAPSNRTSTPCSCRCSAWTPTSCPTAPTRAPGPPCAPFAARFRTATRARWTAVFEGTDACVAPVLTLTEAADHKHLTARGTYTEAHGVTQPAPPRFAARPAPGGHVPGAHTHDVARDWDVPELLKDHC